MTTAALQLIPTLQSLTTDDRAALAHVLLSSLDDGREGSVESLDAELARRRHEIISGQAVGVPAEEVFSHLKSKYA